MKILIATEKPFAHEAVEGIKAIFADAGYETVLLEKYTDKAQLLEAVADVEGLIIRSDKVTAEVLAAAPKLRIVVRAGAGYDNVDLAAAKAKGVVVMNTPGQNSNAVAELALGMMVYMARNQFTAGTGSELQGKRIGIHAYGNVGRLVGRKAKALGMEHPAGALVASVLDGEPAAKAGIEAGDVITKVNGKSVDANDIHIVPESVEDASALLRAIAAHKPGAAVTLAVWRNGKAVELNVTLGDRQAGVNGGKPSEAGQKQQNQGQLGLTVRPLKDEERRELKLDGKGGLLVLDVDSSKPAAEAGVRPGDVIIKANRQTVSSPEDLSKIVTGEGSKRGAVMLQINRRGENIFRAVPVSSGK